MAEVGKTAIEIATAAVFILGVAAVAAALRWLEPLAEPPMTKRHLEDHERAISGADAFGE